MNQEPRPAHLGYSLRGLSSTAALLWRVAPFTDGATSPAFYITIPNIWPCQVYFGQNLNDRREENLFLHRMGAHLYGT
jgi:hypothetical protein